VKAGFAQIDITPPVGAALTGYIARDGAATGVHDPLFAKAMVLDDEGTRAALLTCDTLGLHLSYVQQVRAAIESATQIPAAQIMIACSHTHAGPATLFLQDCGVLDEGYLAQLRQHLVAVTKSALAGLRPVRLGIGYGEVLTAVHNRRKPGDVTDPSLGVLRVADEAGATHGVVLNFACHPTCLNGDNRLISAEYCGHATHLIEQETGATTMFLTGAIGDVGPVERGWPVLAQLGEAIALAALRTLDSIATAAWQGVEVRSQVLELPLLPLPPAEQLEDEQLKWRSPVTAPGTTTPPFYPKIQQAMLRWAERTLEGVQSATVQPTVTTEVQVIRAGELALVSAPGELFVELGLAIKQQADARHVFVCGFANDNIGYIPTRRVYPQGGYEIAEAYKYYGYPAALAPEAGELFVKTACTLTGRTLA
jgi:hypothetical protein